MISLQHDAEDKDAQRIRRMQQLTAQREERFRNPRSLAMGVDSKALDAQVSERRRMEDHAREEKKQERMRVLEMEKIMESAAMEEKAIRDAQIEQMKHEWDEMSQTQKEMMRTKKMERNETLDLGKCGVGAVQSFAGEDPLYAERIKAQKEQMRRWIQEQVTEKAYKNFKEKEEEANYAAYVRTVDDMLSESQCTGEELRRQLEIETRRFNEQMAQEKAELKRRQRYVERKMDEDEISTTNSSSIMVEDVSEGVDDLGHVKRIDAFRGFSPEHRRAIIQDNFRIEAEKRRLLEEEKRKEMEFNRQNVVANRQLDKTMAEEAKRLDQEKQKRIELLKAQMEEQVQKEKTSRSEKYGKIDQNSSLFAKFGR